MTERITRKTVSFLHPFALAGVEGEQPAGTYAVETTEEPIGGLSFIAYRRVSTTIVLASQQFGHASRQVVTIDPLDLEAAQKRDAIEAGHRSAATARAGMPFARPFRTEPTPPANERQAGETVAE
jgi:hypothetical protein